MTSYTCLSRFTAEVKLTCDYTRRGGEHHTQPEVWSHSGGSLPAEDGSHSTDQQKGQKLAMQDYPWGSQRSYLKNSLTRLSMLILSKTYLGLGYTLPITKLMEA
jgi:hypothetical protein